MFGRMVLAEGPAQLSQPRHRCPETAALLTERAWVILVPVQPKGATSDMESHQTQGQEVPGCQGELGSITPHPNPRRWSGLSATYTSEGPGGGPRGRLLSCVGGCTVYASKIVPHFDMVTKLMSI